MEEDGNLYVSHTSMVFVLKLLWMDTKATAAKLIKSHTASK